MPIDSNAGIYSVVFNIARELFLYNEKNALNFLSPKAGFTGKYPFSLLADHEQD